MPNRHTKKAPSTAGANAPTKRLKEAHWSSLERFGNALSAFRAGKDSHVSLTAAMFIIHVRNANAPGAMDCHAWLLALETLELRAEIARLRRALSNQQKKWRSS
jgi:hypothetical protein